MEDLGEQERNKQCDERGIKLLPEYCHGKTCFCHSKPGPFVEMFYFYCAQGSKEDTLKNLSPQESSKYTKIKENLEVKS